VSDYPKTSYSLFDVSGNLIKQTRWHTSHKEAISGLSFDPTGQKIALIDETNHLSVLDVTTDQVDLEREFSGRKNYYIKCRWNPKAENVIAIKDGDGVHFYDIDKQADIRHKVEAKLDGLSTWIDWKKDGNLLAWTFEHTLHIIDCRQKDSAILKYDKLHEGLINCVKWNPEGELKHMKAFNTWEKPDLNIKLVRVCKE